MKRIEVIITVKKDKGLLIFLLLVFVAAAGLFFADHVRATLTCSVAGSCADVTLLKMYATGNSHAGLPASSAYTNLVCCADAAAGLSNNCTGTYAPVGTLSSANNAHYEDWLKTNYSSANDFCLSVTSGTITVSTSTDCGVNATLFSFSGTSGTNAHVGNSAAYATKICGATGAGAATLTLTLDSGDSTSLGTVNSGTPVTGTTRLKIDTNNSSGYYIIAGRNNIINSDALFSAYGSLTIDDSGIPTHTTGCTTPKAWAAASTGLGFTVYDASGGGKNTTCWGSASTETGANLYAAFAASVSATTILNETDNSPNPSYVSVGYKLDVTSAQTATTYNDGQIVFTATTN